MPKPSWLLAMLAIATTSSSMGCAAKDDAGDVGTDDADVVAGERSGPSDDAVVHVYSGVPCTGVLVGPSLVMTALHCVARDGATANVSCGSASIPVGDTVPASAIRVSVGSSIYALHHHEVKAVVTSASRRICNGDVAVLVLSTPVTGVTPLSVRTTPVTVGQRLTAIGWGVDGHGMLPDFRRRRSNIAVLDTGGGLYTRTMSDGTVRHITSGSKEIVTGESICQGDSGGPLLDANRRVAAIVSRVQSGCIGTLAVHSDASYWHSLLDEARLHL